VHDRAGNELSRSVIHGDSHEFSVSEEARAAASRLRSPVGI
jgi:hypothetical protein